jgi:hypothetical protein
MSKLWLFYLYYNNPEAIANLEAQGLPEMDVPILIVDDGSPVPLNLDWPNVTVIRIEEDIPWNMSAANNRGFAALPEDAVILRMDIDHWIGPGMLEQMKGWAELIETKTLVKFERLVHRPDGAMITPSPPNIYLARVKDLIEAGGYDERFVGHYGHEDTELMWRLKKKGFTFATLRNEYVQCMASLGTKGLDRDSTRNKQLLKKIMS